MNANKLSEEAIEEYKRNTLSLDDTFCFSCKMCGDCCRNRDDAIVLTGVDIFYIAKALGISTAEVIGRYTEPHIGFSSKTPIFTLAESSDGSCSLLRKGKCRVQSMKPTVCAIFPLGRMSIPGEDGFRYFRQPISCSGRENGENHTVREWIDSFHIQERDAETKAWTSLFTAVSLFMRQLRPESAFQLSEYYAAVTRALYFDFPLNTSFVYSVRKNAHKLVAVLPEYKEPAIP